jgi:hypothetical protein
MGGLVVGTSVGELVSYLGDESRCTRNIQQSFSLILIALDKGEKRLDKVHPECIGKHHCHPLSDLGSWRPGTSVPHDESLERLVAHRGSDEKGARRELIEVDAIECARHAQFIDWFQSLGELDQDPLVAGIGPLYSDSCEQRWYEGTKPSS